MRYINGLLLCLTALAGCASGQAVSISPANPCATSEQRQLDFWVGEWDLTWPGDKAGAVQHGTNSVRRVLDSCVVEENFSGGTDMHLRGKSVSIFDATARKWKQTWVDNEGGYLDFVGELKDGQVTLGREVTRPDGGKRMQRMVFKNIGAGEFDWSWEGSRDGGKTWKVVWPIHYQRRK